MFKTKSEVDKHVGKIFLKAKTDSEKNRECFKIARLYFGIKEYKYAKQYLANYLSEISDDSNAWKLMAEIAELNDNNWQKAIDCYTKYFDTNQQDTKILLKICSCYLKLDRFEPNSASRWLAKAEQFFPYEKQVIEFKERLFSLLEQTTDQWEMFLLKGITQNYYNEDLHFKLVKMYLKNDSSFYKAIKHLLNIEHKSLFDSSPTWHKSVIDLIEKCSHFILNDSKYAEKYELLNLVYLMLSYHHVLISLQENSIEDILNLFIKFDNNISRFESYLQNQPQLANTFHLASPYQLIVLDEIKSHYHYICGMYILKSNLNQSQIVNIRPCTPASDDTDDSLAATAQLENYDHLNKQMLACVCLANCSLFSKPNNKQLFTDNIDKLNSSLKSASKLSKTELHACVLDLLKCIHRDSNWRYSNVGNWLKFQMNKTNDEIKFLKSIKKFSKISNIRQTIADSIGLSKEKLGAKSFMFDSNNFQFQIDKEKFYVMDHLSLDYADKFCLSNQSFNLKYLVWHTLINVQIDKNQDEFLPYFYFRNLPVKGVKFGVDNFNICNLESLSLIDMKLFLFSVSYQTLSQLNKQNDLQLEPYWLQSNLCSPRQYDWWFNTFNYLISRDHLTSHSLEPVSLDSVNSSVHSFNLDIKKQTELAKVLELLRLKHGFVKLNNETFKQQKFKVNLKIATKVAKYFQTLVDHLVLNKQQQQNSPSKDPMNAPSNQSIYFPVDCEFDYSPQEKLDYLKQLTVHYWTYVSQQLIKLKQLKSLDETYCNMEDLACSTIVVAEHAAMASYNESFSNNQSKVNSPSSSFESFTYFDYVEPEFRMKTQSETTPSSLESYDLCGDEEMLKNEEIKQKLTNLSLNTDEMVILTALLNLVLNKVDAQEYKDAINLINQLDKNAEITTSVHINMCKRLSQCLIENRKQAVNNHQQIQDINTLIDFIEKKLKLKSTYTPVSPPMLPVIKPPIVINQSDLNSTIENESRKEEEIEEEVEEEEEEEKEKELKEEEEKRKGEELKEELKIELPVVHKLEPQKEEAKPIEQKQPEEIQIEIKPAEVRIETVQVPIFNPVVQLSIPQSLPKPEPAKQEESLLETGKIELQLEQEKFNQKQNEKIQLLIETLKEQRSSHFKFNTQLLEEQFLFIKDQHKKLKHEISQLNKCSTRRNSILDDFRKLVKDYHALCDLDSFNKQFNVFYWLFQQQPNFSQMFIEQNKHLLDPTSLGQKNSPNLNKPAVEVKPIPVKNENNNNNVSFSTTFSQNEYCTPKQDRSQMSAFVSKQPPLSNGNTPQSFLQKPIGEINFPLHNVDMIERFKDSANKFKQDFDQSDLIYDDQEPEDEDDNEVDENEEDDNYLDNEEDDENQCEDEDQVIAGNLNQSNKQETFLSCNNDEYEAEEEEATGYFSNRNTKYYSNLTNTTEERSLNKSSIEILFDQAGLFYDYDENQKCWMAISKAKLQILADDGVSQRGFFQAFIICNLIDRNKSIKYELNEHTVYNSVESTPNSLYWSPTNVLCAGKSGAFKFDKDNCVQDLKNILNECQLRVKRNSRNDSFSSSCSQNNLIRKEITFCLNDSFSLQVVTLNVSKSLLNQFMISILHDSNLLFQHVLRKDQKFETSEKVKQLQYICKYTIEPNLIQLNSLNTSVNLTGQNQLNIKLIFQTKIDLNDFLNLFKN